MVKKRQGKSEGAELISAGERYLRCARWDARVCSNSRVNCLSASPRTLMIDVICSLWPWGRGLIASMSS
ncbi:hypothetical protein D3C81_2185840 [compost metagenome]